VKNGKRLPTYMEPEEMERLLAVSPPCHRLCFLLWARAGLRVAESVKVRHEDIIWRDEWPVILHVIGKNDKEALLPLGMRLRVALRDFTEPEKRGWLFPGYNGHIVDRQARYWMVRACERAGIAQVKAHPHALRHSFATHLLRAGADLVEVRDLMRHSSLATTSIYLHSCPERLQGAVDRLG